MSNKSSHTPEPLRLELKPSRYLRGALLAVALLALGAIFFTNIALLPRAVLASLVIFYLGYCLRQHNRHVQLHWSGSGWLWRNRGGDECLLRLQHSTVWPGLIVLQFRDIENNKTRVLTLLNDSFDADDRRHLRVYLRHLPVFGESEE